MILIDHFLIATRKASSRENVDRRAPDEKSVEEDWNGCFGG
jgi:hypothetical protein